MIPHKNAIVLFRFGEQRWIDKNIEGELSFSCAGAFIHQARKTGNNIQGDELEAVFARLHKDDSKVDEMVKKLGRDLEIIEDGEYVYLRRKSAKFKPIFCFYGYKGIDLLIDGKVDHVGLNQIRHDFDQKLYSGFSNIDVGNNTVSEKCRFTQLTLYPKPFVDRVKVGILAKGYKYHMRPVDYELKANDTFFIDPTEDYFELFYKQPEYKYQYEARICLPNIKYGNIFERLTINIGKLSASEYKKTYEPMYLVFDAIIDNEINPRG